MWGSLRIEPQEAKAADPLQGAWVGGTLGQPCRAATPWRRVGDYHPLTLLGRRA